MLRKDNVFIKRIIQNYKNNPNKKIVSDNKKSLTYSQLINLALSNSKKIKKIESNFIPIIVERNIETVVAILTVIFSKKIFCPISNKFPNERINLFLKILECNFLINCSNKKFNDKNELKINYKLKKNFDKLNKDFDSFNFSNLEETFYLLFTSGTTGAPKGVKLSFKNIYNTIIWSKDYLNWKNHKIGIATEFSFDISMFDLFSGLYYSVPIYIFQNPSNPFNTIKEIKKNKVTSIFSVPTFFSNFIKYNLIRRKFSSLRRIISGGDFFSNKDILSWKINHPKINIFNVWGPTETSIVNAMYKIQKKDIKILKEGQSIPAGKSHPMMRLKILKNKKEVPKNKIGEICMIGNCVSQGYVGHNKNSKNYFQYNTKRAYLTGDLGYLDKKNNLHIVGRKDNTLKISGYRIDALEVENIVNMNFNVTNSCLIKTSIFDINILCLVIETKKKINYEKIIKFLKRKLPSYSLPKKVISLKKFPLNQNNKIDRNKIKLIVNEK